MPTNGQRVLDYLRDIVPAGATNPEIVAATGIRPYQQVYQTTQDLLARGRVWGRKGLYGWRFWYGDSCAANVYPLPFLISARPILERHLGVRLSTGFAGGTHRRFDFLSPDGPIVGDAWYHEATDDLALPRVDFAAISECAWLLEKVDAKTRFLVFGGNRLVPEVWLQRYSRLELPLAFYFLSDDLRLETLSKPVED
jgi:hypothetical protein